MAHIQSLKLTIQDVYTKDTAKIAAVMGTLYVDHGEKTLNEKTQQFEPVYEKIDFTSALFNHPTFKEEIRALVVEALMLKGMEIAKETGTFAHEVVKSKLPVPKKRVSKVRTKK